MMVTNPILFFVGLACSNFCYCYPQSEISSEADVGKNISKDDAFAYLKTYGYVEYYDNNNMRSRTDPDKLKQAIKDYQCTAGLKQTGELDEETKKMMGRKRCGISDSNTRCKNGVKSTHTRQARYSAYSKWPNNKVSYRIVGFTNDMSNSEVNEDFSTAMQMWSDASQLKVTKFNHGVPDMKVGFYVGEHGDHKAFDGSGGVLAHAYYPGRYSLSGDIHFDDAENFQRSPSEGIHFLWVATHEAGHALGLAHSNVYNAVMYPYYTASAAPVKLDSDDIDGIQYLYGRPEEEVTDRPMTKIPWITDFVTRGPMTKIPWPTKDVTRGPMTKIPKTTEEDVTDQPTEATTEENKCAYPSVDAISRTSGGKHLIFKGRYYYKKIKGNYERNLISDTWANVTSKIDAALYYPRNGLQLLIMGDIVNAYRGKKYLGFSRLDNWIKGLPSKIDSIFTYKQYRRKSIYVTVGNQYYKINTYQLHIYRGYPRPLSNWFKYAKKNVILPLEIDAAFVSKSGQLYFFSKDKYYFIYKMGIRYVGDIKDLFDCPPSSTFSLQKNNRARVIPYGSESNVQRINLGEDTFKIPTESEIDEDEDGILIDNGGLIPFDEDDIPIDLDSMINTDDVENELEPVNFEEEEFQFDNRGNSSSMIRLDHTYAFILAFIFSTNLKY